MRIRALFFVCLCVGTLVWAASVAHGSFILFDERPGPALRLRLSRWRSLWGSALMLVLRSFMRLKVTYRFPTAAQVVPLRSGPCIVVSNHQHSLIEPLVLPGLLERLGIDNVRWIAKDAMKRAWGWGPMFRASGFAWVRRGGHASDIRAVEAAAAAAAGEGASFALFPEGTRAPLGQVLPPKAGGFMAAVRNMPHCPVVSVTFAWDRPPEGGRTMLDGASLFGRTVTVTVRVHEPVAEAQARAWLDEEWERMRKDLTGAA
ncbi:1-acyl-sn-glycerol-3-phosphate acyltransferase [Patescibacteria group bacterium]|nr:MAG: 1-acyl-sn-glycerol-3-phosphate acyltransferase [Patescibacteria group bacterium]